MLETLVLRKTKAFLSKEDCLLGQAGIVAEPDISKGFYECQLILLGNSYNYAIIKEDLYKVTQNIY